MELHAVLHYVKTYLLAVTPAQWYVVGSVVGGALALIGVVAWIKRRHLKKTLNKLESWFIQANLVFWGLALTLLGFIVQHGSDLSVLFPYLGTHGPQLVILATTLYSFGKGIRKWFADRKAHSKTLVDDVVDSVTAPDELTTDVPVAESTQPPQPSSDLLS